MRAFVYLLCALLVAAVTAQGTGTGRSSTSMPGTGEGTSDTGGMTTAAGAQVGDSTEPAEPAVFCPEPTSFFTGDGLTFPGCNITAGEAWWESKKGGQGESTNSAVVAQSEPKSIRERKSKELGQGGKKRETTRLRTAAHQLAVVQAAVLAMTSAYMYRPRRALLCSPFAPPACALPKIPGLGPWELSLSIVDDT